jgi:hypothetical protein
MDREKRQSPRIDVFGELQGRAVLLDEPVRIREMSAGGLTIATKFPLRIGTMHQFQLTLGTRVATVSGRIVHRRVAVERDETSYVSGIQFVDVSAELTEWLQEFMEALQTVRS